MSEGTRAIDRIMRPIVRLEPTEYNRIYDVVNVLLKAGELDAARKLVEAVDRAVKGAS